MKNQYFGDINDFEKYALLRHFEAEGLNLAVVWMLTPDDGGPDGKKLRYLDGTSARPLDPELFDWLREWKSTDGRRSVALFEQTELIRGRFVSDLVSDDLAQREDWFVLIRKQVEPCDVVFLDPDNGMEIGSCRRGSRRSSKYVYWRELRDLYEGGHSLVVYQHLPREIKDSYIKRRVSELRNATGCETVLVVHGRGPLFFCAVSERDGDRMARAIHTLTGRSDGWFKSAQYGTERRTAAPSGHSPLRTRSGKGTTAVGYVNRNRQMVIEATGLPGSDHLQTIYVLGCNDCRFQYGANGSDIFQRKCPACQGGRPGIW